MKQNYIRIRCTDDFKQLVKEASYLQSITMTDFITETIENRAISIVYGGNENVSR